MLNNVIKIEKQILIGIYLILNVIINKKYLYKL